MCARIAAIITSSLALAAAAAPEAVVTKHSVQSSPAKVMRAANKMFDSFHQVKTATDKALMDSVRRARPESRRRLADGAQCQWADGECSPDSTCRRLASQSACAEAASCSWDSNACSVDESQLNAFLLEGGDCGWMSAQCSMYGADSADCVEANGCFRDVLWVASNGTCAEQPPCAEQPHTHAHTSTTTRNTTDPASNSAHLL
ncbi:unnamed protein product [Polarella glacialis]|uniref:Uncharacterized protein n=1 Tax=Polarella glacialis TaxID=89957 RepID=A0A813KX51_POLGL|nr:unnamed protein product [Polarella glacialis]